MKQTVPQEKAQFGFFRLTEGKVANRKRKRRDNAEPRMQQIAEAPVTGENGIMVASRSQSSQESEWAIREGNAPTPDWAKRPSPNDAAIDEKPLKTETSTFRTFVLAPAPDYGATSSNTNGQAANAPVPTFTSATEFAADFGTPAAMHPIDRAIMDIAHEFQFVPNEVRAFYERTGDLNATRQRFERMRALMNAMP